MSEHLRNIAAGLMVVCVCLLALAGVLLVLMVLLSVNDWLWYSHPTIRLPVLRVAGWVIAIAMLWWIGKIDRAAMRQEESNG